MATKTYDNTGAGLNRVHAFGQPVKVATGQFAFDSSYPTGGEAMDLTDLFAELLGVLVVPTAGYTFDYDYTNKKIKVYQGDNPNAAAAPGVEVPNTTNLSTLTARFIAWGR